MRKTNMETLSLIYRILKRKYGFRLIRDKIAAHKDSLFLSEGKL